jgi:SH3 domain-containing YSC84-like protein 1
MRGRICVAVIMILACFVFLPVSARADNKWTRLVEESGKVLGEVQQMPDRGIPADLIESCSAIAIFPSTVSAAFGIGGQYGQGIVMAREEKSGKWMPPAVFTIAGASLGFQIGAQATDYVLLIMNRRSVDGILQGKFKLGADANVAAGPVGRSAQAATDIQFKGGILSYSRNRGLFIGVNLAGTVLAEHWDGDQELYGKKLSAREIMLENKVGMPQSAHSLLEILDKYPPKR